MRAAFIFLLQCDAWVTCNMNVAAGAQRCVIIGRQILRMDNAVLRDGSNAEEPPRREQKPHDGLTDVEIMECADADGRRDRWPVIGDGNTVRTCVHAFPQHGHSRPSSS